MDLINRLSTCLNSILHVLLPQRCLSCKKLGESICEECLSQLPKEASPYGITTIFAYSDPVIRKVLWLLKYKSRTAVVRPLARIMYDRIIDDLSETNELVLNSDRQIVIIPVPLSRERFKERGFNQAEVIAKEIVECGKGPGSTNSSFILENRILTKTKHTPSQVEIKNKTDRLQNLKGAFKLDNQEKIKDKIVILIDDVTTTGATMEECTKTLKRAKPRKIIKIALAH